MDEFGGGVRDPPRHRELTSTPTSAASAMPVAVPQQHGPLARADEAMTFVCSIIADRLVMAQQPADDPVADDE